MAELVDELDELIRFPTISRDPVEGIAAHLAERLESAGFATTMAWTDRAAGKCNVIARRGPEEPGGLCLSGHMDVVPTEGQPWTSDPFRLTERGGRLHARGTADMKGFIAGAMHALVRLRDKPLSAPIMVVWTHDEEVGCQGSSALVNGGDLTGPVPQACLIGEPTGFRILRQHAGHVTMRVSVTGRAAHTSKPHLGVNAIEAAAAVIRAVTSVRNELARQGRPVPITVARIAGGRAVNVVPDSCDLQIGFRPLPGTSSDEVFDLLSARIRHVEVPHEGIVCEMGTAAPSMLTEEGTALQRALTAYASDPSTGCAPFATDGGNLARLGMHPLVFGPGSIDVAHRADEYITVDDLMRGERVVHGLVRDWCVPSG